MKLFTKVEIGEIPLKIQHSDRILTLGSCFAENIGRRILTNKFHSSCNPFGIIYNPVSLSKSISRITRSTSIKEEELLLCQNSYCHIDFHSQYNRLDKQATVKGIKAISASHAFANEGLDWLIVSLGTSFVYQLKETNEVVANCHKLPSKDFTRKILNSKEIVDHLFNAILVLKETNPKMKTLFTVSPIRHVRDGLKANTRSKARLIDAAQAVNYIWEQFQSFALSKKSQEIISKIESIHKMLKHKPFLKESEEYQNFLSNTAQKMQALKEETQLDFSEEEAQLSRLKRSL